uniref:C2H2-type domain-containing protein n=1 Tax=Schistosoma mansoni TaxID=6183 RepID=A0A5K4F706_SCHMA
MTNISTRSVPRPEYLEYYFNLSAPSAHRTQAFLSDKEVNTNNAPVFCLERKSHSSRLSPESKRVHPCSGPSGDRLTNSNNLLNILWPRTSDRPEFEAVLRNSSPSLSFLSTYPSDSKTHSCDPKSYLNASQSIRDPNTANSKSHAHGQAEQIRRSRESITFSLIDSQLSIPPLNQIRDIYLQTRSTCGNSNSTARTTKKTNLSVVHTIVRFRIKEYLIELREHIHRTLDTLFHNLIENYEAKFRDSLATEILGLSSRLCFPDCDFCSDLLTRDERYRTQNHDLCRPNSYPSRLVSQIPSNCPSPFPPQISTSFPSNDTARSLTSDASYIGVVNNVFPDRSTPVDRCNDHNKTAIINSGLNQYLFPDPSYVLEKPLPSYHNNVFDSRHHERVRLDSTSLHFPEDLDYADCTANDIPFSPFGEELVDLHSLVFDSISDIPSNVDETSFDPAYDISDLMQHFA